jgi:hypothetical protein
VNNRPPTHRAANGTVNRMNNERVLIVNILEAASNDRTRTSRATALANCCRVVSCGEH